MPYLDLTGEIPSNLPTFQSYQIYNCLDCAITAQLYSTMRPQLTADMATTYAREKRIQKLCLELSTNGFPVDQIALAELLYDLEKAAAKITTRLEKFCRAVDHLPINPRSPKQVAELFYTHLRLPIISKFDSKTRKSSPSTDVKALEKLRTNYPIAAPFVQAILGLRETTKMASVFKRGLEPGGSRLRCNYTPTGTETGRLSSQKNPYNRGTNAQNLTNRVRQVVKAPAGFCLLNCDLKSAESIAVGFISGCKEYINACLDSDLHTAVAKMNWTDLAWTGDPTIDRRLADQPYYRHFSYRDMAKRGGHGTNYYGTPRTMAMYLKLPTWVLENFQRSYFAAFPEIPEWHLKTIATIQQKQQITTQLKRVRRFWGRPNDPKTHREAIAYHPQSLVGDVMNEGLLQVLHWAKRTKAPVKLIAQVHDSGLFLVPIRELKHLAAEIQRELLFPVDFGPLGVMEIPSDLQVGLTWAKAKTSAHATRFEKVGLRDYKIGQDLHF